MLIIFTHSPAKGTTPYGMTTVGGVPPLFFIGIMLRFFVKMCPGATFGARISKGFHAGDIELRSAAKLV